MYNRFTNHTFTLENAPIYEDEVKKELKLTHSESNVSQDSKPPIKRIMRQPGFPLVIELKSKRNKNKSRRLKPQGLSMLYKPKLDGQGGLSPVYSNLHGKVMYVMSAKLIKNVKIIFPKSLLTTKPENYPHPAIESDVKVDIEDKVFHYKKKIKPSEENIDIYEKEYNTTSEYRRNKNREVSDKDQDMNQEEKPDSDPDKDQEMKSDQPEQPKEVDEEKTENNEEKDQKDQKMDPEDIKKDSQSEEKDKPENKDNISEEQKLIAQENDNKMEEYDESDEEYSGEGCFIGYRNTDALRNLIVTPMQRFHDWNEKLRHFKFITPKVRSKPAV